MVTLSNENEFNAFVSNKKNEALKDRMILVKVPYNLRLADEVRIYEKLLGDSGLKGVHIAPHTLRVSSIFAILTRLEPSKKAGMSLMKKLKLYDGEPGETVRKTAGGPLVPSAKLIRNSKKSWAAGLIALIPSH